MLANTTDTRPRPYPHRSASSKRREIQRNENRDVEVAVGFFCAAHHRAGSFECVGQKGSTRWAARTLHVQQRDIPPSRVFERGGLKAWRHRCAVRPARLERHGHENAKRVVVNRGNVEREAQIRPLRSVQGPLRTCVARLRGSP